VLVNGNGIASLALFGFTSAQETAGKQDDKKDIRTDCKHIKM
jgi:hypothetical protein